MQTHQWEPQKREQQGPTTRGENTQPTTNVGRVWNSSPEPGRVSAGSLTQN
jgi:hypothetical protein